MLPSDPWERGDPYERYMGRWSRQVASLFVGWLRHSPGQHWLDVGCGTGALCSAIVDLCAPAWVAGMEPSDGFLRAAAAHLAGRVRFSQGFATAISLESASVDTTVSALVLNFIEDAQASLWEMLRVTRAGERIGAYVWDYAGKMEMLRLFWDTVVERHPEAAQFDEGIRFPLCYPDALKVLFAGAGLYHIAVTAIDLPIRFASFEDYWMPFLGGQGPAPAYLLSLDDELEYVLR